MTNYIETSTIPILLSQESVYWSIVPMVTSIWPYIDPAFIGSSSLITFINIVKINKVTFILRHILFLTKVSLLGPTRYEDHFVIYSVVLLSGILLL